MARTLTFTETYARLRLLQINIKMVLIETGWPPEVVNRLVDVGLSRENRWLYKLNSYGLDPDAPDDDLWLARFGLHVDWDEHDRLVVEYSSVQVDERWEDGVNPGLKAAARAFAEDVRAEGLVVAHRFSFVDRIKDDLAQLAAVRQALNSRVAASPVPAGTVMSTGVDTVGDLAELSFSYEIATKE